MTLPELREALLKLSDAQLAELAGKLGLRWDALDGLGRFGHTRDMLERARARRKLGLIEEYLQQQAAPPIAPTPADVAPDVVQPASQMADTLAEKEQAASAEAIAPAIDPPPKAPVPLAEEAVVAPVLPPTPDAPVDLARPVDVRAPDTPSATRSPGLPLWLVGLIGLLLAGIIGLLILRRINDATVAGPASTTVPTAIPTLARANVQATSPVTPSVASPTPGASIVVVTTPSAVPTIPAVTVAPATTAAPAAQATSAVTQTAGVTVLASATPRATDTPAPTGTPTAGAVPRLPSEPDSPAAFVNVINQQVMDYLQGKVTPQDLAVNWQGTAYTGVQEFLDRRVTASLSLAPRDGKSITSTMRYLSPPDIQVDAQGNAAVRVREGWKYGSRITGKTACETRDYFYRLVRVEGRYKVDEFTGTFVDARCFE